jgi:hypothetical protein
MIEFPKWFCLKDRLNFTINPQINSGDARFYFGRDDIKTRLQRQLRRSLIAPGVPKLMVWGPYGSGKTQALFYLEHYLKNDILNLCQGVPHTLYVAIEMRSNSTAAHLHRQMMEALGKETVVDWIIRLFDQVSDLDVALEELVDDPNIVRALKEQRISGDSAFYAWRWLTGQILTTNELNSLLLTRNLGTVGVGDLVNVLVTIGNLADKVGEKLIFLLDELEELQNVRAGDASESIHQYFRRLAEPANASVGFLVSFKADVFDDAPSILLRSDIISRVGTSNYVEIPPLPAVSDVQTFVSELLQKLIDQEQAQAHIAEHNLDTEPGVYPFEHSAFELLADYATQDPTRALPRYIINAINECAIQSWDEEKYLVDEGIVNDMSQYVFA